MEEPFATEVKSTEKFLPINTEDQLYVYACNVSGTPAVTMLDIVLHYLALPFSVCRLQKTHRGECVKRLWVALRFINIACDFFADDARQERTFLAISWLEELNLAHSHILDYHFRGRAQQPSSAELNQAICGALHSIHVPRLRLLDSADAVYLALKACYRLG